MQLRSDRIIASTPRHGYRIRKPAQEELRDIINFRTVMECSFLERYHDMVTKDRIRELRTLCQEYENGRGKPQLYGILETEPGVP